MKNFTLLVKLQYDCFERKSSSTGNPTYRAPRGGGRARQSGYLYDFDICQGGRNQRNLMLVLLEMPPEVRKDGLDRFPTWEAQQTGKQSTGHFSHVHWTSALAEEGKSQFQQAILKVAKQITGEHFY